MTTRTITVTLTEPQVDGLLNLLSYGEDFIEDFIEECEADPSNAPSGWRQARKTLMHAKAARQVIATAKR